MNKVFDVENFNLISDEENYYFFRALNMADNQDIETKEIVDENGELQRIRTDRERYEENKEPKYSADSKISLEQVYDHVKMHYRRDTNCISLSSNANVSIAYGRGNYKDKYVMVKVPKRELGQKVVNAGQYMLEEIDKRVEEFISSIDDSRIKEILESIERAETAEEIRDIIERRYTSKEKPVPEKARLRQGITYKPPVARVSNYKALNNEQSLEKNRIVAKLTILERMGGMQPIIPYTANNTLLVQTIGSAFSSLELINYGDIEKENIIDLPKEIVDIFALLQQINEKDEQTVNDLKREVIKYINEGGTITIPQSSSLLREDNLKENITVEEMYSLTGGRVEYGSANSVVKKMFYLSKAQLNARALVEILKGITKDNPKYKAIYENIASNGFRIEPQIITRKNNKGVKISESISLDLEDEEVDLIDKIKSLSDEELIEILENGGLSNVKNIMSDTFSKMQQDKQISKEEYYAEAIFSLYNWQNLGIESFTIEEKNNLLQKIRNEYCVELYQKLEEQQIDKNEIPTILLNMVTRERNFEATNQESSEEIKQKRLEQYDKMIKEELENFKKELSIGQIERFLGYYDVQNTGIKLRPYQQRATERTDEIFETERFASVILPTGAGKSFVAISQLMEHQNEEILYIAPQNEILEQMKDYIIKYIHGPINTLGRSKDDIVADVFPNIKFSTYPGLLSKQGEKTIEKQYGFIVLDELHRTGAKEWGDRLNTLIENQNQSTKVLGITATPRRDSDGINMANEMAEKLGYTNAEAVQGKHIAMNISLTNAIKMGLVVNPKLVSCLYSLATDGSLDRLKEKIDVIDDILIRNEKLSEYESLRRNLDKSEGISEILQKNVKKGGKYIVFLPIVDEIEDEDGNLIGRRKGKDKIEEYQKQIAQYFKDSDITPNFHSMLGEYGDKENEKRLEEFQNRNTTDTEFMLVMNKANEGLHLDQLDGMIWLRQMDENSRILYLQQLGRVVYSEDPDNPTKDKDRPIVIDLVNNTLKVNWENEITSQDDIQMLNIIINWTERHNGTLPNINSTDKEEKGYATALKEIQNKYQKYLENNFDNLNEKQIEEVKAIIRLGSQIDLWQIVLPEEKVEKEEKSSKMGLVDRNAGPFKITGLLKDFVNLENEVNSEIKAKSLQEEIIEFVENSETHSLPRGNIRGNKNLKEEEKNERNLYQRWRGSNEKRILEEYIGKAIEEVPEEYREFVRKMREYGHSTEIEKSLQERILEFVEKSETNSLPRNRNQGKKNLIQEEKDERNLYSRWVSSVERKILEEYRGKAIEEVPEEYREFVKKMREYGHGIEKKKSLQEEIIEFVEKSETHNLPRSKHKIYKDMTKEEKNENNLYAKWLRSDERRVLEEYRGKAIEEVPEEYREFVKKMREYGHATEKEKSLQEKILEFVEKSPTHSLPKKNNNRHKNLTQEEKGESNLYDRWNRSNEKKILEEYIEKPIEEVPEECREFVRKMREYGHGIEKKKSLQEEIIEFVEKSPIHSLPRSIKRKDSNMTQEEKDERNLYARWRASDEKKKLDEYIEKPIEEVPEEYREFVSKMREYGYGTQKKEITGREIAEATISSLKHMNVADNEERALMELVEKEKEGGMNLDGKS